MYIGHPCPICKKKRTYLSAQGAKKSEGRNCRESGKVRGILCELCNKGLGQFKDDKASLAKSITYLEENS